ncbi:MAG: hypothetical protein RLZZ15_753 [Verrucomicrobiota bacterium]|jgi:hypothetical protein
MNSPRPKWSRGAPAAFSAAPRKSARATLVAFLPLAALLLAAPAARAEVLIERTMLPDAHASSFAFGLPGGVNFCYDPIRGGVNYAWTGDFLDLTGVRPVNKLTTPAKPLGPIVHRETGPAPLRRGDPARAPVVEFKGYTLREASVELRYTIDGVLVRETITALPQRTGLRREFRLDPAGADAKWFYAIEGRPATPLAPDATGALVIEVIFPAP